MAQDHQVLRSSKLRRQRAAASDDILRKCRVWVAVPVVVFPTPAQDNAAAEGPLEYVRSVVIHAPGRSEVHPLEWLYRLRNKDGLAPGREEGPVLDTLQRVGAQPCAVEDSGHVWRQMRLANVSDPPADKGNTCESAPIKEPGRVLLVLSGYRVPLLGALGPYHCK